MSAIAISGAISSGDVAAIAMVAATSPVVHGRVTSGSPGKRCWLLDPESAAAREAGSLLLRALQRCEAFAAAVQADAMTPPTFASYRAGDEYPDHVDAAVAGDPPHSVRVDIAVTVCLSSNWEGGDLVVDVDGMPARWRGNAGDVIVYPASTLHRVEPVTAGSREVALLWVQSAVREASARRDLYDLWKLTKEYPNDARLRRVYFNLVRRWT